MAGGTDILGPPQQQCNCFWGNPIIAADGSCTCPSGNEPWPPGTGGIKPATGMKWTPWGWVPRNPGFYYPPTVTPPVAPVVTTKAKLDDGLIFGFSPLVVIGAAVAGLFLLSSMDGKK